MTSKLTTNAAVLFLLTVLTIIVTWPLIFNLNRLIMDRFDGLLITWFLNWDIHCLTSGLKLVVNCYNANIFYPYSNTLAFSETMFPQAVLSLPFVLISGEPLLAYNINFILGFILTGFAIYLLAFSLTKEVKAAVLAGILFTFSTIHLNYMAHLQLFNLWPVVFATQYLLKQHYRRYIFFFIIASLTTPLYLYFLLVVAAGYWLLDRRERTRIIVATARAMLITCPFLLPYFFVSRHFNYVRPINDAIHFSLQFPQLLNVSSASRLGSFIPPTSDGTPAYFGVVFIGIVIAMSLLIIGQRKKWASLDKNLKLFLWVAGVSFILALGPALHIFANTVRIGPFPAVPLPYAVFYYLLPGFSGLRTPSRWIILTALSLCLVLAIYFKKKLSSKTVIVLGLLVLVEVNFPFEYQQVPSRSQFPPEQVWLKANYAGQPIIQFPIYNWDDLGFSQETLREYYSTIHWHPMYNGYSGFSPPEWEKSVKWLQHEFPSSASIQFLRERKIKLVLVPADWSGRIDNYTNLQLTKSFENTNIYELK